MARYLVIISGRRWQRGCLYSRTLSFSTSPNSHHHCTMLNADFPNMHCRCYVIILQIPFTAHVTNQVVHTRTAQPPDTQTIMARRLRFFGHIVRSDTDEDHKRALDDPPKDWRRPRGRPRQTWLRTIENDLKQQNLGLWSARTEHMIVNFGVKLWKLQRSCRGTLHDDDESEHLSAQLKMYY